MKTQAISIYRKFGVSSRSEAVETARELGLLEAYLTCWRRSVCGSSLAQAVVLILSGLVVYVVRVPPKVIGALAGFGAGALISAIAFDLIPEGESLDSFSSPCGS